MSDYLCPNCGPISDEGDMECLHDSESLYCALCGASEEEMTPLLSAYAQLQSDLTAAKADAGCWKIAAEGAKAEIERLRGQVAELEEFAADAQKDAWRALDPDYVPPDVESAMKTLLHRAAVITGEIDPDDIEPSPWLLRKQAEAFETFVKVWRLSDEAEEWFTVSPEGLQEYARRLRQQADELDHD